MRTIFSILLAALTVFFAAASYAQEASSGASSAVKTEQLVESQKISQKNEQIRTNGQKEDEEEEESSGEEGRTTGDVYEIGNLFSQQDELFNQKKKDAWNVLPRTLSNGMTIVAILILLCACASKLSTWINMPSLLVFLAVGMLFGEEGIGHIRFDNAVEANVIGSIAMAFILFSGGFDTDWKNIRNIVSAGGILSSLGVLLTALGVGIISFYLLRWTAPNYNVPFSWCLLLGSIVSSTDAAAVFAILRSRNVSLRPRLRSLLEFESGSNDPMAAFLTVFMVGVVLTETASGRPADFSAYRMIVPSFIQKMLLGVVLGITWGKILVWLYNKIDLEYDGLYYVLGIGTVILSYGATELLQGNGFMSVYVTGLVMGNSKFIYRNGVRRFSDGIAWLMQVVLFGMLGLLVSPHILLTICWQGLAIALILMLFARPAAVFLCMMFSKYDLRERLLISWVGLRGGAPIMLATFPLMADIPHNIMMFHIVFFIVLTSVIFQGMTLMPFAKLLKLDMPLKVRPRVPLEFDNTGTMNGDTREFEILPDSRLIGTTLSKAGLPKGSLVLLVRRGKEYVVPHGDTVIQPNDGLLVLAEVSVLDEMEQMLKD